MRDRGIDTVTGGVSVITVAGQQTGPGRTMDDYTQTHNDSHTHTIASAGGGTAHGNMPPAQISGITMIRSA